MKKSLSDLQKDGVLSDNGSSSSQDSSSDNDEKEQHNEDIMVVEESFDENEILKPIGIPMDSTELKAKLSPDNLLKLDSVSFKKE